MPHSPFAFLHPGFFPLDGGECQNGYRLFRPRKKRRGEEKEGEKKKKDKALGNGGRRREGEKACLSLPPPFSLLSLSLSAVSPFFTASDDDDEESNFVESRYWIWPLSLSPRHHTPLRTKSAFSLSLSALQCRISPPQPSPRLYQTSPLASSYSLSLFPTAAEIPPSPLFENAFCLRPYQPRNGFQRSKKSQQNRRK